MIIYIVPTLTALICLCFQGKYVEIQFSRGGEPIGGKISNFLLEKVSGLSLLLSRFIGITFTADWIPQKSVTTPQSLPGRTKKTTIDCITQTRIARVNYVSLFVVEGGWTEQNREIFPHILPGLCRCRSKSQR